jgi:CDP-4-dehydro-6-deoxyglucose reductase
MSYQVTLLPSGHHFATAGEDNLLQAALDAGFTLPYGCRDGACGTCKARVVEGDIDPGHASPQALSEAEKRQGFALLCCARPLSDVTVECRELTGLGDIVVKKLPARVEALTRAAPDVMLLTLKLPTQERLQFLAGQYIDILLKDGRRRSFSIASPPHQDGFIELHIRHLPGGVFTDHVFGQMKVRDILRFEGPLGTFFLREDSDKPIILLAGGTGFAPIKSVVEASLHKGLTRPMTLYWGARDEAGLYLRDLAEQWAREHAHIRFVPVLSEATWAGRQGLVHEAVMADHPDLSGFEIYACGAPGMIDAARRDFTGRCGLPVEAFFADVFSLACDGP